jgi:hypothetical protein
MNSKWMKIGMLVVALVVGLLAFATLASAQGPGNGQRPFGPGGFGGPQNSVVAVAAKVLGMDQPTLVAELNAGKTIADVAKEKGVALDTIVDAIIAGRSEALKSAVVAGRMTQAQADEMLTWMRANITARLNAKSAARGFGGGMGFVDADQDGLCDHYGANQPHGTRGRPRR